MTQDLRDTFKGEIEQADWSMLEKHNERGALFLIDRSLNLIDVAMAFAMDDVESVAAWQTSEKLRRPTRAEADFWRGEPYVKMANFVIVQPFVIIEPLDD